MRVLNWIVNRVNDKVSAVKSPFGYVPRHEDLNWEGLDFHSDKFKKIMDIDQQKGLEEAEAQRELFDSFKDRLPSELESQRQALKDRLKKAPPIWHAEGLQE